METKPPVAGTCPRTAASAPPTMPIQPPPQPPPKRPIGIIIISILWFLGGLWNLYTGITVINDDLAVLSLVQGGYGYSTAIRNWVSWAVPLEIIFAVFVLVLGIMQFVTIYGLMSRKSWSYKTGIGIPVAVTIISWSDVLLAYTAPVRLQPNLIFPIANIVGAIIYIAYLRQAHVKQWLNVGA